MPTPHENDLFMIDKRWTFDREGDRWVDPRSNRALAADYVRENTLDKIQKVVYMIERGFLPKHGGTWVKGEGKWKLAIPCRVFNWSFARMRSYVAKRQRDMFLQMTNGVHEDG